MLAKTLMIQGAMSSVGKSMLVTALCRIYARQGIRVAPFKAQNMSNNAAVTVTGGEIGRAQYTQALACNLVATVAMNPVLIKPEADMQSQVIVNGTVWENLPARTYYERKAFLWQQVTTALDNLREDYDLILIEGAGSPAELNLKRGDIVNMAVATYLQSPVLLAGDIDRGGVFAQLLGTLMLLDPDERKLIKGFIVNKFRGDPTLFEDGITILEQRGGVPVLGVIPYVHAHGIPEEDAVAIETQNRVTSSVEPIDIAVIAFPRIANFDDFDALGSEIGVRVRYITDVQELGDPSAVILPGTKSTIADYGWLETQGFVTRLRTYAGAGGSVVGICGGYQMVGQAIHNPDQVESPLQQRDTLGLLPTETRFLTNKSTYQVQGQITGDVAWLSELTGTSLTGYEIHMGQTVTDTSWLTIQQRNGNTANILDGSISQDGKIWGCYMHGIFDNVAFRRAWLKSLGWKETATDAPSLDDAFNRLADVVEAHLDMDTLHQMIGL